MDVGGGKVVRLAHHARVKRADIQSSTLAQESHELVCRYATLTREMQVLVLDVVRYASKPSTLVADTDDTPHTLR